MNTTFQEKYLYQVVLHRPVEPTPFIRTSRGGTVIVIFVDRYEHHCLFHALNE